AVRMPRRPGETRAASLHFAVELGASARRASGSIRRRRSATLRPKRLGSKGGLLLLQEVNPRPMPSLEAIEDVRPTSEPLAACGTDAPLGPARRVDAGESLDLSALGTGGDRVRQPPVTRIANAALGSSQRMPVRESLLLATFRARSDRVGQPCVA